MIEDKGPNPFVCNIEEITEENTNYRTTVWTGKHLQLTVMSIEPGDDIGLEIHHDNDQFLRIEKGVGKVQMGDAEDQLTFEATAEEDFAIFIPAGKWHNVTNVGDKPMQLYSIYAPAHHPHGAVHPTKADAEAAEAEEHA